MRPGLSADMGCTADSGGCGRPAFRPGRVAYMRPLHTFLRDFPGGPVCVPRNRNDKMATVETGRDLSLPKRYRPFFGAFSPTPSAFAC